MKNIIRQSGASIGAAILSSQITGRLAGGASPEGATGFEALHSLTRPSRLLPALAMAIRARHDVSPAAAAQAQVALE